MSLDFIELRCPHCDKIMPHHQVRPGRRSTCRGCSRTVNVPKRTQLLKLYVSESLRRIPGDPDCKHESLAKIAARAIASGLNRKEVSNEFTLFGLSQFEAEQAVIESERLVQEHARADGRRMLRRGLILVATGLLSFLFFVLMVVLFPAKRIGGAIGGTGAIMFAIGVVYVGVGMVKAHTGWNIR